MRLSCSVRKPLNVVISLLAALGLMLCQAQIATAADSAIFVSGASYVEGDTGAVNVLNGMYAGPEYEKSFLNNYAEYTPNLNDSDVDHAVDSLYTRVKLIRAVDPDGTITIVCGSLGSIVGSKLNDRFIADGYPTGNIQIVALVNPQDPNGGYVSRFPASFAGNRVTPPDTNLTGGSPTQSTGAKVASYKVQYDLISDFLTYALVPSAPVALLNNLFGFLYAHPKIFDVDLDNPNNVSVTSGNLTSTLLYNNQLPLTQPLLAMGVPQRFVDALDPFLRAIIETAYQRPNLADPTNPANDPSKLIPLQFLPPIGAWIPDVVSVINGAVQTIRLLIQALLPVQQVATVQTVTGNTESPMVNARLADVPVTQADKDDVSTSSNSDSVSDSTPAKVAEPADVSTEHSATVVSTPITSSAISSVQPVANVPTQVHDTTSSTTKPDVSAVTTDKSSESTATSTKDDEPKLSTSVDKDADKEKDAGDDTDKSSTKSSSGTGNSSSSSSHSQPSSADSGSPKSSDSDSSSKKPTKDSSSSSSSSSSGSSGSSSGGDS